MDTMMYAWSCRKWHTLVSCVLFAKTSRNGFFFNHVARAYLLGTPLWSMNAPGVSLLEIDAQVNQVYEADHIMEVWREMQDEEWE